MSAFTEIVETILARHPDGVSKETLQEETGLGTADLRQALKELGADKKLAEADDDLIALADSIGRVLDAGVDDALSEIREMGEEDAERRVASAFPGETDGSAPPRRYRIEVGLTVEVEGAVSDNHLVQLGELVAKAAAESQAWLSDAKAAPEGLVFSPLAVRSELSGVEEFAETRTVYP